MLEASIALAAITLIGLIAQHLGICLVRATREAIDGSPWFLLAILMSGFWVWAYSILALSFDWPYPLQRFDFHLAFAFGGLIFGIGSSINQGCSISTMNSLTRGNIVMSFTMLGWLVGWSIWAALISSGTLTIEYQMQAKLPLPVLLSIAIPMALITFGVIIFSRSQRKRWLGILLIGCLAGVLYYVEPAWAPSRLIKDSVASVLHQKTPPSLFRFALVAMLLLGMILAIIKSNQAALRWPNVRKIVRHLSAGTLMGIGASMALGGNDAQLMMGLPAASIGGITALIFMVLGITLEQYIFTAWKKVA